MRAAPSVPAEVRPHLSAPCCINRGAVEPWPAAADNLDDQPSGVVARYERRLAGRLVRAPLNQLCIGATKGKRDAACAVSTSAPNRSTVHDTPRWSHRVRSASSASACAAMAAAPPILVTAAAASSCVYSDAASLRDCLLVGLVAVRVCR